MRNCFYASDAASSAGLSPQAPDTDDSPKRTATTRLDAYSRVIDVLKDSIAYLDEHGNFYRDVLEKHFMQGLKKEQLAKFLSDNMQKYVNDASNFALRHLRVQKSSKNPIRVAEKLNRLKGAS